MKVLLVDDHPVARRGLQVIVTTSLGDSEILEADNATVALDLAQREQPEMILLDARMPESTRPAELCGELRQVLPGACIVIVTAFDDVQVIRTCLDAGANGCLLKDTSEIDLGAALKALLAGAFVMDPRIAKQLSHAAATRARTTTPLLTDRERDVLALLAHGLSNRQIAQRLFLSETTVKGYVTDLLHKLKVSSRLEAVVRAYKLNLVTPPSPN